MSGDDSGSSGSSGEYTTDDLIGKWTSNDTGEGFRENIFTFLNATQVEVYDGSTTETMNYTLSGSSITIDGQPDYVKSMTLISKTQFIMTVYMYDISLQRHLQTHLMVIIQELLLSIIMILVPLKSAKSKWNTRLLNHCGCFAGNRY